jgi:hypothetical protein
MIFHLTKLLGTKAWPFRHKRFAASTCKTGKTSIISSKLVNDFLGNAMVPKSQRRQTFPTIFFWKTETFTLNCGQTFMTIGAIAYGKLQVCLLRLTQAFNVQKAGLDMLTPKWQCYSQLGARMQV